jgi:hypothetical protein
VGADRSQSQHRRVRDASCRASRNNGRGQIEKTLNRLKAHLGVHRHFLWLGTYYQYVNRRGALHFLNDLSDISAQLLHVYFVGDCFPDGREIEYAFDTDEPMLGRPPAGDVE